MRKISTRTHAVLDYLTVGTFFAVANFMPASRRLRGFINTLAMGKLAYAMMTRHELAPVKLIPMKVHLALDAMGGAALAAAPFLLEEDDETTTAACVGLGLTDILVAPLTQTEASFDRSESPSSESSTFARPYDLRAPGKGPEPVPTPNAGIHDEGALPPAARRDTGAHATPVPGL
jgi:hypothetical protein